MIFQIKLIFRKKMSGTFVLRNPRLVRRSHLRHTLENPTVCLEWFFLPPADFQGQTFKVEESIKTEKSFLIVVQNTFCSCVCVFSRFFFVLFSFSSLIFSDFTDFPNLNVWRPCSQKIRGERSHPCPSLSASASVSVSVCVFFFFFFFHFFVQPFRGCQHTYYKTPQFQVVECAGHDDTSTAQSWRSGGSSWYSGAVTTGVRGWLDRTHEHMVAEHAMDR